MIELERSTDYLDLCANSIAFRILLPESKVRKQSVLVVADPSSIRDTDFEREVKTHKRPLSSQ